MDATGAMTPQQDLDALLAGVAMGDRKALRNLYARVSPKIYGIADRLLRDDAQTEEAVRDVFVQVWSQAESFRASGLAPMTWLVTLTREAVVVRLRASRHNGTAVGRLEIAERLYEAGPSQADQAQMRLEARTLFGCLEQLPPERADMMRKAYLKGYTYPELAEEAGLKPPVLRAALRRSLLELRMCLSQ